MISDWNIAFSLRSTIRYFQEAASIMHFAYRVTNNDFGVFSYYMSTLVSNAYSSRLLEGVNEVSYDVLNIYVIILVGTLKRGRFS